MRYVALIGICAIVFLTFGSGGQAKPAVETSLTRNGEDSLGTNGEWLIQLIFDLLGITAADLLNLIYNVLANLDLLVQGAVKELQGILSLLHPEAKEEIERIIFISMKEVNNFIQPIMDELREVLPLISNLEEDAMKSVSDWIMLLFGVTLEEFLTTITSTLRGVNLLIRDAIVDLGTLAESLNGEAEQTVDNVVENMFVEGLKTFLGPLLEKLFKLFPEHSSYKIMIQ